MSGERWELVIINQEVAVPPTGVITTPLYPTGGGLIRSQATPAARGPRPYINLRSERGLVLWEHDVGRLVRLFFKRRCWASLGTHLKLYARLR